MTPSANRKVGVVILTWNGKEDTLACLETLRSSTWPSLAVIVADNGSKDGTEEAVREEYPEAHYVQNGENLGFAGGNNTGIKCALDLGAEFVLVLNNDTEVPPEAISGLVATLDAHPEAGASSPVMPFLSSPDRLWFAGSHYDATRGRSGRNSAYELGTEPLPSVPIAVDRAVGAAFFVRRAVVEEVGMFEPDLFYLHEDVDWSLRIKKAGWTVLLDTTVHIPHHVAASQGGSPQTPLTAYYGTRNDLELGRRHGPTARWRRAFRQSVSFAIHLAAARNARKGERLASVRGSFAGLADYRARQLGRRR